jgi:putative ABC transport system permease protein
MEKLLQDVRYGCRGFLRQPGFSLTAILALALGIGANTAVFSVVYAVLLKPLPYPQPEALVLVHDTYPAVPSASVSFAKLVALRQQTRTLSALGGFAPAGLTLTGGSEPEQIAATRVSADFFKALNVAPLHGRWFTDEEDTPNGPKAIVLSYGLWQRRFGGDPAVLNTAIPVDGVPRTIVGIMPDGRLYPTTTQAWIPLQLPVAAPPGGNFMRLLGRKRPGVTMEQATGDLRAASDAFNKQNGFQRDVKVWELHDAIVTNNRRMLLILQGTVAFVLLVACANVANLLLARSVSRQRELAVRSALGAGRGRIFRQVLTESVMLSVVSGTVGVLLAMWLLRLFVSLSPASFPRVQAIAIDTGVLGFTLLVAMATGILFGLAPARQGFRTDPNDSLKDTGTRGATGGSRRTGQVLVAAEIALALVLVIGAGLMVKSLLRLQQEAPGYDVSGLMTFNLNLPQAKYPNTEPRDFYRRLLEEIRSVPGVLSAAAINFAPMTNFGFNGSFTVVGQPAFEQGKAPVTEYRFVSPGYFGTMAIPVLRGSDFAERNNETDRPVVIINDTMARTYFGGADPIGQQMQLGTDPAKVTREVVGVVADVRDAALAAGPVPEVFIPHAQVPLNAMAVMVRTSREMRMDAVLPSIRERVRALDADVAMIRPQMLQTAIDATAGSTRLISVLTSVFAFVAALLASVGVYSLIAYSVAQRTREIGIRTALGANRTAVVRLIVGEGLTLATVGILIGLTGAYFLTQTLQTLLYEVRPTDPVVLLATCTGVFGVVLIASIVPAVRALRVDPMIALRAE